MNQKEFEARAAGELAFLEGRLDDRIVGMLKPSFVSCDASRMAMTVAFPSQPWEGNKNGSLFGGIVGSFFDLAMGILTHTLTDTLTPTISLNISFLSPAPETGTVCVESVADRMGSSVIYVSARMWAQDKPETLIATAQSIFRNHPSLEPKNGPKSPSHGK